jgi:hypothetical protein
VSELDYMRRACEELPAPSREAIAQARGALQREIEAAGSSRATHRRLRITVLASTAAAAVAFAAVLLLAVGQTSFGVRIAQAANEAVTPASDELGHLMSHTTVRWKNRAGSTMTAEQADDIWWTTTPPVWRDRTTYPANGTEDYLLSGCGSISYDSATNLFTVSPSNAHVEVSDPVASALNALRRGQVHYRRKLLYHGIPAAKLVVTQYGSTTTYIVRRDTGYPLETIDRRSTSYSTRTAVTTYSLFQHLRRTRQNESRLTLPRHVHTFVVRTAPAARTPACREFGSLDTLTGRRRTR